MRTVDALPGKVTKMEEDDSLKEGAAMGACRVEAAAPVTGDGGERGLSCWLDADNGFEAHFGEEYWAYGWHRLTEPPKR